MLAPQDQSLPDSLVTSEYSTVGLHLGTDLGRELVDIITVCRAIDMDKASIHAAILGRIGVCASSWGVKPTSASPATHQAHTGIKGIANKISQGQTYVIK